MAVKVFLDAIMVIVELMALDFPDRKTLDEFKEQIRAEVQNPAHHLYAVMYGHITRY
jgi:hypothetical protein